jgi:NAD(P)H dehydrogenase (quinone)
MIVVTGASGKFGRHVIDGLLETMPASEIVAAVRSPESARDLEARGVRLRHADYTKPETLAPAFAGADRLMFISASEIGVRLAQHAAVINGARAAGVKLIVYTSILNADSSRMALASEHKGTEQLIRTSGIPFVFLRNGWYFENHTASFGSALEHGAIIGAAGNGRFASAPRAAYAQAAVRILREQGHEGKSYELAGDSAFTLAEMAAELSAQSGKSVRYQNLPVPDYAAALLSFGLPVAGAEVIADADAWAAMGDLDSTSNELRTLVGAPLATMAEAVAAALARLPKSAAQ